MIQLIFDPSQPYRFARYARMSSDKQNPRSPDQQFATIYEELTRRKLPWIHVTDYRDDAISGRYVRRRKGLQQMLQDIRSGAIRIDLILLDTFERFGRASELRGIREELANEYGVLILTADSGFTDPTTPAGEVLSFVESFRAKEDNRIKSHNVRRGKLDTVRQKHWPGGNPPLGYKLESVITTENGRTEVLYYRLVAEESTAWIVRLLYQKAQETGWGQTRLANFLNNSPDVPAVFKPFQGFTVGYILANAIYVGEFVYQKTRSGIHKDRRVNRPNDPREVIRQAEFCEPLVPRELWDEVQRLRIVRGERLRHSREQRKLDCDEKLIQPVARGISLKYPLTGLVVCGVCGRAMTPSPSPVYETKAGERRRYVAYACPGPGAGLCSNRTRIPEPWLRERVAQVIRERVLGLEAKPPHENGEGASPEHR